MYVYAVEVHNEDGVDGIVKYGPFRDLAQAREFEEACDKDDMAEVRTFYVDDYNPLYKRLETALDTYQHAYMRYDGDDIEDVVIGNTYLPNGKTAPCCLWCGYKWSGFERNRAEWYSYAHVNDIFSNADREYTDVGDYIADVNRWIVSAEIVADELEKATDLLNAIMDEWVDGE